MTKQEEIREVLENKIKAIRRWEDVPLVDSATYLVDDLLNYLHSQGVVIKVDRELPKNTTREVIPGDIEGSQRLRKVGDSYYEKAQKEMISMGYVTVKSLIGDK